jgi:hypothetical protein
MEIKRAELRKNSAEEQEEQFLRKVEIFKSLSGQYDVRPDPKVSPSSLVIEQILQH